VRSKGKIVFIISILAKCQHYLIIIMFQVNLCGCHSNDLKFTISQQELSKFYYIQSIKLITLFSTEMNAEHARAEGSYLNSQPPEFPVSSSRLSLVKNHALNLGN
jgi:dolichyl-phosphate-mannose--protein O-mannosyl transferase